MVRLRSGIGLRIISMRHKNMFNWARDFLPIFIATAILAMVILPSGFSFSSEIHRQNPQIQADETRATALSEELNTWEDAASESLIEDVPGPGAFLGIMLRQLAASSAGSDDRIKKLFGGIQHVFPDLNKVLVAL